MPTPMAMRFWLFRRARTANEDVLPGRALSLEHVVRSRVRMFLRHTWLVTILGALLLGAAVWAAIHFTMARDYMRIAAGPLDARFVHALSNQLATDHRNLHLQIVPTTSPQATAEAMSPLLFTQDLAADGAIIPASSQ
jgi:hypothetical protein